MKKLRLLVDILTAICLIGVAVTTTHLIRINPDWGPGGNSTIRNWHYIFGYGLAGLVVVHFVLSCKAWLNKLKKARSSRIVQTQTCVKILLIIALAVCTVSGIMWQGTGPQTTVLVRYVHSLSAFFTFMLAGLHVGLHFSSFLALFKS